MQNANEECIFIRAALKIRKGDIQKFRGIGKCERNCFEKGFEIYFNSEFNLGQSINSKVQCLTKTSYFERIDYLRQNHVSILSKSYKL